MYHFGRYRTGGGCTVRSVLRTAVECVVSTLLRPIGLSPFVSFSLSLFFLGACLVCVLTGSIFAHDRCVRGVLGQLARWNEKGFTGHLRTARLQDCGLVYKEHKTEEEGGAAAAS